MHPGFGLADDDRDLMGAGLAEMLEAATASGKIDLVALQARTVPDDGTEHLAWVAAHMRLDEQLDSGQVHVELDAMTAGAAVRREAFVAVVVGEEIIPKAPGAPAEAWPAERGSCTRSLPRSRPASPVRSRVLVSEQGSER